MTKIRFAYLQKAPSAHADACLRALARSGTAELFVTLPPTLGDTPYDAASFTWLDNLYPLASLARDDGLLPALTGFRPDVILVVGWEVPLYRRCARRLRNTSLRVVGMDNQWLRTPKQLLGVASSRIYLRPYFDAAFLPGRRQAAFASKLGFPRDRIFEGFYSADVDAFREVAPLGAPDSGDRRAFVFVGRLASEKGINSLAEAYGRYRTSVDEPWKLVALGRGPLESALTGLPGVEVRGFVEPRLLPDELAHSSFLVLPSTFEPWGVVVHEAASAGLGCICTAAVGAADAFVRDGVNGRIIAPGSVSELAEAMRWAHGRPDDVLADVSRTSRALAQKATPELWAETVLEMAAAHA
jgi:glycosyltransferase involved in cell wall biosynthesis